MFEFDEQPNRGAVGPAGSADTIGPMAPRHDRPRRRAVHDPLIDGPAAAAPRRIGVPPGLDRDPGHQRTDRRSTVLIVAATAVVLLVISVVGSRGSDRNSAAEASGSAPGLEVADADSNGAARAEEPVAGPAETGTEPGSGLEDDDSAVAAAASAPSDEVDDLVDGLPDLVDASPRDTEGECVIAVPSLRQGSSGGSVECLQLALIDAGVYSGPVNGQFDASVHTAVLRVQEQRALFVDGVVGRETALSLHIWPEEEDLVIRTPPPPPGAMDSMGYLLSSVATSGADAPPLPENSGSGKRVVYDRMGQRVWAVDDNERVIRSWLVSGSQYANEVPGTHFVYSRSEWSTAWNGAARLPMMIRWYQTERGHLGFHGIPLRVSDGGAYQTEAELGTRLSGGCQRQSDLDALFLWNFAPVGTKVVVL